MNNFTEKQLSQFGQYLLSQTRKNSFKGAPRVKGNPLSMRQRLALVHDADVANFKDAIAENPDVEFTPSYEVILKTKKETVS